MPRSKNPSSFGEPIPTIMDLIVQASARMTTIHLPCTSPSEAHYIRNSLYAYRKAVRTSCDAALRRKYTPSSAELALDSRMSLEANNLSQIELSILVPLSLRPSATTKHPAITYTSDPIPLTSPPYPVSLRIAFSQSTDARNYNITQRFAALADTLPVDEMANIEREAAEERNMSSAQIAAKRAADPSAPRRIFTERERAFIRSGGAGAAEVAALAKEEQWEALQTSADAAAVDAATKTECLPAAAPLRAASLPDPYNMPQPVRTTDDEPTYEEQ